MAGMSSLGFGQDRQDQFFDSNGVRIRYIEQWTDEPVVLVDIEKGSMRTLVSLISPKGQPMPSEEVMKQAEASFLGGQDLAALAAVARSFRNLKITDAQVAAIKK